MAMPVLRVAYRACRACDGTAGAARRHQGGPGACGVQGEGDFRAGAWDMGDGGLMAEQGGEVSELERLRAERDEAVALLLAMVKAQHAGPITDDMFAAWLAASKWLDRRGKREEVGE